MAWLKKIGLVVGGYVIACLIASVVVYAWQLLTQSAVAQASSGMYAFGDLLLFLSVFGILALIPTGVVVFFLLRAMLRKK